MKTRENVGVLLNELGALVMQDTDKVDLLNTCFASVFFTLKEFQYMEIN